MSFLGEYEAFNNTIIVRKTYEYLGRALRAANAQISLIGAFAVRQQNH